MKNEYTIDEMRQELAKALKEKIDAYSQKLVELRNRELAKAEEVKEEKGSHDSCPLCGKEDAPHACICLHKAGWKKSATKSEEVEKCGDMSVAKNGDMMEAQAEKSEEVEKCGDTMGKSVEKKVKKGELMIDRKKENTPGKRLKDIPEGSETGVLPSDEKSKVVDAEGSGGEVKKVKKGEVPAAKPPTGAATPSNPPAASNTSAPKNAAPKAPVTPPAPAMKAEEPASKFPEEWKKPVAEKAPAKVVGVPFKAGKVRGTVLPGTKPTVLVDEIKKSELGNCLLCGKGEHAGKC